MRMSNFSSNTTTGVCLLVIVIGRTTASVSKLAHQALNGSVVGSVWVGADEAGKMIDVAAGEAKER